MSLGTEMFCIQLRKKKEVVCFSELSNSSLRNHVQHIQVCPEGPVQGRLTKTHNIICISKRQEYLPLCPNQVKWFNWTIRTCLLPLSWALKEEMEASLVLKNLAHSNDPSTFVFLQWMQYTYNLGPRKGRPDPALLYNDTWVLLELKGQTGSTSMVISPDPTG